MLVNFSEELIKMLRFLAIKILDWLGYDLIEEEEPEESETITIEIPTELLDSFDRNFETMRLEEYIPRDTSEAFREFMHACVIGSYCRGYQDGRN